MNLKVRDCNHIKFNLYFTEIFTNEHELDVKKHER